jgi:Patatin-like phospholipase
MSDEAKRGDHGYVDARDCKECQPRLPPKSVYDAELAAIDKRRQYIKRNKNRDRVNRNLFPLTGIALSGGGIRSASFGLGALQALDVSFGIKGYSGFDGIDYLSTVSGGGYIGCSLTATMQNTDGKFPFTHPDNYDDTDSVRHIRDFSNYLIPHGALDVVTAIGIIGRGFVANVLIVLPVLLFCVWMTLVSHPTASSLDEPRFLIWNLTAALDWLGLPTSYPLWGLYGFWFTAILAALNLLFLIIWALWTSLNLGSAATLRGGWVGFSKFLFLVTLIIAFFEAQPFILWAISSTQVSTSSATGNFAKGLAALFASMGTVFAFFSKYLGDVVAAAKRATGWQAWFKKISALAALWLAALIVPAILWLLYLWLTYIAISYAEFSHLPDWLASFNHAMREVIARRPDWVQRFFPTGAVLVCLEAFFVTLLLASFINPNRTSLYRLYRDRLSKAFLFDPEHREKLDDPNNPHDLLQFEPKLFEIDTDICPYPIVNAALNIEGSQYANKRGRNADFFVFTPEYLGSDATGYIGTQRIETEKPPFNLGTAMAISGAAVSSNMGAHTIKPLAFTLAVLNVRLGYWLRNPRRADAGPAKTPWRDRLIAGLFKLPTIVLFAEMFSWITEKSPKVYLTDGGHIENLGVYSLMKRRCNVIIVVDAEADPTMSFGALLTLERYARIDLGAIIDLPWHAIQEQTLKINKAFDDAVQNGSPIPCTQGPHCAAGEIQYGPNEPGILLYVKASLSGDEPDYVLDYKRRHQAFPHETTGDQFFCEEQLEAYRALGFHIMKGLLSGEIPFAVKPRPNETEGEARLRILKQVRAAFGIAEAP